MQFAVWKSINGLSSAKVKILDKDDEVPPFIEKKIKSA